jgi:DNA-binding GntR family transcriptional regulator
MMNAQSRLTLAAHVLKSLTVARADGRLIQLDELVDELGVPRADVRAMLSQLHAEGLVDVLRMSLTMKGLALGSALARQRLAPLHPVECASAA